MIEILHLLISIVAMETLLSFERFYFPFSCCRRESPFAQCLGVFTLPTFDPATFCVGVLAVGGRTCVTHNMDGPNGFSS